jgi:dihydrofolate reductase
MQGSEPTVALIAAIAENGVIGRDGAMPWRIKSEMRHFRRLTMDKPVIMGRKTFGSLKKPLDGRDNIVLTRNRDLAPKGAIAVESIDQALKVAGDCAMARSAGEIMVIGGAEIYALMMPYARRIYLTRVHGAPEGDVYFPEIDLAGWDERERSYHARKDGDEHDYTMSIFERRADPQAP